MELAFSSPSPTPLPSREGNLKNELKLMPMGVVDKGDYDILANFQNWSILNFNRHTG
jgi:hypothetical protein